MVLLAREEKCLEYWWGRAGDIEKLKKNGVSKQLRIDKPPRNASFYSRPTGKLL